MFEILKLGWGKTVTGQKMHEMKCFFTRISKILLEHVYVDYSLLFPGSQNVNPAEICKIEVP